MNSGNLIEYIKSQIKHGGVLIRLLMLFIFVFIVLMLFKGIFVLAGKADWYESLFYWLSVSTNWREMIYKPWTLITAIFIHADFGHLFWNAMILYFLGQIFLVYFGEKRLLSTFVLGAIFGFLIEVLVYAIFKDGGNGSIVGASGGILALVGAILYYRPKTPIKLFFFIEVPFWVLALLLILGDLAGMGSGDQVAHLAHLGGLLFGILSAVNTVNSHQFMNRFDRWLSLDFKTRKKAPKFKVHTNKKKTSQMTDSEYNKMETDRQKKVDAILDKISKSGYDSLSKSEKDFLFKQSQQ